MEFSLRPYHDADCPPQPTQKTPYISHARFSGPWATYPSRMGHPELAMTPLFDIDLAVHAHRVHPIPIRTYEGFIQTWLYFGLLAEFTAVGDDDNDRRGIEGIYNALVVKEKGGEEGRMYVVLDEATLGGFVKRIMASLPGGGEVQYLNACLSHTHSVLYLLPPDFSREVRFSIYLLGEMLQSVVQRLVGSTISFGNWSAGYYDDRIRAGMRSRGWCPSDIARCEAKFASLQTLDVIQMMDKKLPVRDHGGCTEDCCNAYQIDRGNYHVRHCADGCHCEELAVDKAELSRILFQGGQIPLLRFKGGLEDLSVELVESTPTSRYIAISHIWADGLGNPYDNALHQCKLLQLRDFVAALSLERVDPESTPLIWLDTLCCPAEEGPGKDKGIEKIYNVYKQAEAVLVLDSGLMSYAAAPRTLWEQGLRIFTSPWMRRLWTLQEGALARSLYFQFADQSVSLKWLIETLWTTTEGQQSMTELQQRMVCSDMMLKYGELRNFFHSMDDTGVPVRDIYYLERALQYRGVSVPTDEPLCIGALMSLDMDNILRANKEDRMQAIWQLLADIKGGLSSRVIFWKGPKLSAAGWRWAPRSLLQLPKGTRNPSSRAFLWDEKQLGQPTRLGLRVRYPGFRLRIPQYTDSRPRNPWPGLPRNPEVPLYFRTEAGLWYAVADGEDELLRRSRKTEEDRSEHGRRELCPLHDLADGDNTLVLSMSTENNEDAIFATAMPWDGCGSVDGSESVDDSRSVREDGLDGLHVHAERQITISSIGPDASYIMDAMHRVAMALRDDELTDTHLRIFNQRSTPSTNSIDDEGTDIDEAFGASLNALEQKIKDQIASVIATDARFADVVTWSGELFLDAAVMMIRDWFRSEYVATVLEEDQVWFVD